MTLLSRGGVRWSHIDHDAAAYRRLGIRQARRDVIFKPGTHQLSDAIKVLWLLIPQDADCPAVIGQDILETAEPWML